MRSVFCDICGQKTDQDIIGCEPADYPYEGFFITWYRCQDCGHLNTPYHKDGSLKLSQGDEVPA